MDSSIAAGLLVQQGYQVIGMMLRLWSEEGREEHNRCCAPDAMAQARRVAAILGIPFYVLDARQAFHDTVVQYFLNGYMQGVTPNPCLVCNRTIRWGLLLQRALSLGAEYLATGHYVRLQRGEDGGIHLLRDSRGTPIVEEREFWHPGTFIVRGYLGADRIQIGRVDSFERLGNAAMQQMR